MNTPATAATWGTPPVKTRRSRVRLDSVFDTRREAARIYRKAVSGDLKVEDASRLVNMLAILSRMIETGEFEGRLAQLESLTQ
jgi:hypothetical protein